MTHNLPQQSVWTDRILRNLKSPLLFLSWWRYQRSRSGENDFFLITMNHGGTHYLRMLIVNALIEYFRLPDTPDDIKNFTIIPPFHRKQHRFKYNGRPEIPRIQQAHSPYIPHHFKNGKVILLIRDLRDAMTSNYKSFTTRHSLDISFGDFLRARPGDIPGHTHCLQTRIAFLNRWSEARPELDRLLIMKFEDVRHAPAEALGTALNFIGLPPPDKDLLSRCVSAASLERMKELEARKPSRKNNEKSLKISDGNTGKYKEMFSPEDRDYFMKAVNDKLHDDFGYDYSHW